MTFHDFLIRPLTHRWVEINREKERVVTNAEWDSLVRAYNTPRLLPALVKANARRTGGRAKRHLVAAE